MSRHRVLASLVLCVAVIAGSPATGRSDEVVGGAAQPTRIVMAKGVLELTPMLSFSYQNLTFSGSGAAVDAGSLTNVTGTVLAGYCFNGRVQGVYGVLLNHQSLASPGSATQSGTSIGGVAGVQYNFVGAGSAIPFIRAGAGVASNSGNLSLGDRMSVLAPIVDVGMRLMVGSAASVNVATSYQYRIRALGLEGMSSHVFGMEIGVSVFRGRRFFSVPSLDEKPPGR